MKLTKKRLKEIIVEEIKTITEQPLGGSGWLPGDDSLISTAMRFRQLVNMMGSTIGTANPEVQRSNYETLKAEADKLVDLITQEAETKGDPSLTQWREEG